MEEDNFTRHLRPVHQSQAEFFGVLLAMQQIISLQSENMSFRNKASIFEYKNGDKMPTCYRQQFTEQQRGLKRDEICGRMKSGL
ncbi:unnamed protein product [Trichobilharzia regenti]|nr:unnamed protein product [Trichobilharzia regenti]